MRPFHPLTRFADRSHLPRRTVRLRLTILYGGLFVVCGAGLLTITNVLVRQTNTPEVFALRAKLPATLRGSATSQPAAPSLAPTFDAMQVEGDQLRRQATAQHDAELSQLLEYSILALAIMAVVSVALGWVVAGRVLAPVRTMTATTRRISEDNLHERLDLRGPPDELTDLAGTIDALLARLEAAFEAQRRFVANASHELRTPLAMMRTSLDVAVAKSAPVPKQVSVLEGKLREGLDQADRLLESFLTLARAQHGALPDADTVDLAVVVAAALQARRAVMAQRGHELTQRCAEAPVTGSETLLARMVENVVDNAIRHGEGGGCIVVRTGHEGALARVTVESEGPPLDDDLVRDLALPFRRLSADRTASSDGVGLGLAIVAAIAAAHEGTLHLQARAEGGLRVVIVLPLAVVPARVPSPA